MLPTPPGQASTPSGPTGFFPPRMGMPVQPAMPQHPTMPQQSPMTPMPPHVPLQQPASPYAAPLANGLMRGNQMGMRR
jgi:hypothetical protein